MVNFKVFGSDVCKDIFYKNNYNENFLKVGEDIGCSLISLMSEVPECDLESLDIIANKENTNISINNDFNKGYLNILKQGDIDYLIMDTYYDVNFGVIDLGNRKFITNVLCLEKSDFSNNSENYNIITIFDNFEEYYNLWTESCDLFFNFLQNYCSDIKVILNTNRHVYTVLDSDGSVYESDDFKVECNKYNFYRDVLDRYILNNYDVDVLNFDENVLVDGKYEDIDSLHYVSSYYLDIIKQLIDIVERNSLSDSLGYDFNKIVREYKRESILSKFDFNFKYHDFNTKITNLSNELDKKNKIINNLPQLSITNVGATTLSGKITFRNWWPARVPEFDGFLEEQWFTRYLEHHFPDADYKINMFSVFGEVFQIDKSFEGKKVFYTPENLNYRLWNINRDFGQCALDCVDFSMGFDLIDNDKYLRVPYWVLSTFKPHFNEEDIINTLNYMRSSHFEKSKSAALICSHDMWGTRTKLIKTLDNLVHIDYAGKWRNNTSELWDKYDNNKLAYLRNFKFNICPENIMDTGYVTEKIFEATHADCIPIYAGGGDYLEPEVLNKNAILLWDLSSDDDLTLKEDNADVIELLANLNADKKSYDEFKEQQLILDSADKFVIKTFDEMKKHFERIIYD